MFALLCVGFATPRPSHALQAEPSTTISPETLESYRNGIPPDQWPALLEGLGKDDQAGAIRSLITHQQPFPAKPLVGMLTHPKLAVRLGALDLLEESAQDTFGFDPWQEAPAEGANAAVLERWKAWAEHGAAAPTVAALDDQTFRSLTIELMSGDRERMERAAQRLEAFGLAAVAHIEAFLGTHGDLEAGGRAGLKSAEYRVVLQAYIPRQAAALARELAFGSSDAQSSALAQLPDHAGGALPIAGDFLASPDPLVREAAVDAAFKAGAEDAVPLVSAILLGEKAENVQHAILRGLGKNAAKAADLAPLLPLTNAASENVAISAIEALGAGFKRINANETRGAEAGEAPDVASGNAAPGDGGAASPSSANETAAKTSAAAQFREALVARLSDSRWRIRVAALEALVSFGPQNAVDSDESDPSAGWKDQYDHKRREAKKLSDWRAKVVELLHDPDRFVRVTAVMALKQLAPVEGRSILLEEFKKQDALKPTILQVFLADDHPPAELWKVLEAAPPAVILECLDGLESRQDSEGAHVGYAAPFTRHPDHDVACCALRLLATHGRQTAFLLEALESTDAQKQDAVLDSLHLPAGFLSRESGKSGGARAANPTLNRLYELFDSLAPPKTADDPNLPDEPNVPAGFPTSENGSAIPGLTSQREKVPDAPAPPAQMRAALTRYLTQGSPGQRFRAAVVLTSQGDAAAAATLLAAFDTYSSLDRRMISGALESAVTWPPALEELALRLLRDHEDDVREKAIEAWLEGVHPERLPALLAEFSRPGSLLHPDDIYGYEMDKMVNNAVSRPIILEWARSVLESPDVPEDRKVLAIVLLGATHQATEGGVERFLDSPQIWMRRAAYRACGERALAARLDTVLADDAAMVRAVVPFLAAPEDRAWTHWFDDAHSARDYEDFDNRRQNSGRSFGAWAQIGAAKQSGAPASAGATPDLVPALQKLSHDPSETVRFEAQFALFRLGHSIDPGGFAPLIAAQPEDNEASSRVARYFDRNYQRLGKGYAALLPFVESEVSSSDLPKMRQHFGVEKAAAPSTFTALLKDVPAAPQAADVSIAADSPEPPSTRNPFRVVFFYKPGCRDCERVREMLNRLAPGLPLMVLEEQNVEDTHGALLNETLSARFHVRDVERQVAPAVFTQAGVLVRDQLTDGRLSDLLHRAGALVPDAKWLRAGATEIIAAQTTIATRYNSLSLGVVTVAGLLDGINPCAFATIVFLLSYLQIARRSPREILAVGAAFIVAVFLAYLLIGLGLAQLLVRISGFRVAGALVTYALAGFALMIAVYSFRDAQLAAQGRYTAMALQLPDPLKQRIRGAIRTGARAQHFVIGGFLTGIVISFLSLSCTGQVYLPTIQYMLHAGRASATGQLVLYNAAFVIPLIIVFVLAWTGLRSEALARFQQRHIPLVKVLTGFFFLFLTAFLLFGAKIFPQFGGS